MKWVVRVLFLVVAFAWTLVLTIIGLSYRAWRERGKAE